MARTTALNESVYDSLPLFDQLAFSKKETTTTTEDSSVTANSGYIGVEDLELSKETTKNGYDLERPARVYSISEKGKPTNLWLVSTRDAIRICSHPKSHGKMYGGEWFYCWSQHDINGEQNKVKPVFRDDGRLKKFEGLEDIKILGVY